MEEFETKVKFEDEEGNLFEMIILAEFDFNKKRYAVLMDLEKKEEQGVGILEIIKDKDGTETFKTIDDDEEFDQVVLKAEEVLYEEDL